MVQGQGRGVADRGARPSRREIVLSGGVVDALVVVSRVGVLAGAFGIGWLVAAHIDPDGWLLRGAVAALIGEGR